MEVESSQSQLAQHNGNAFDLGSKITGSSPAALIVAKSHNGSVGACKALGKGSIPFLALLTSGRAVECGGFENHYTEYRGFESHLVHSFLSSWQSSCFVSNWLWVQVLQGAQACSFNWKNICFARRNCEFESRRVQKGIV